MALSRTHGISILASKLAPRMAISWRFAGRAPVRPVEWRVAVAVPSTLAQQGS